MRGLILMKVFENFQLIHWEGGNPSVVKDSLKFRIQNFDGLGSFGGQKLKIYVILQDLDFKDQLKSS